MTIKIISYIGKAASLVAGLSAYAGAIPEKYLATAMLVFLVASFVKDTANRAGDIADDGQENGSFIIDKAVQ